MEVEKKENKQTTSIRIWIKLLYNSSQEALTYSTEDLLFEWLTFAEKIIGSKKR